MRIITGKYGKRRFEVPKKFKARPTTDFAKEGLFDLLQNMVDWDEVVGLDLFAGTGAIGFEMVSRGAKQVTAIENDADHMAFIKKVQQLLGAKNYRAIKDDVMRYLLRHTTQQFNLIFADPPYAMEELKELPDLILQSNLLSEDGLLVVEHPKKITFDKHPAFIRGKHYGSVHFSFFRYPDEVVEGKEKEDEREQA